MLKKLKSKIAEAKINIEKLGTIIFEGIYLSSIYPTEMAAMGLKYWMKTAKQVASSKEYLQISFA